MDWIVNAWNYLVTLEVWGNVWQVVGSGVGVLGAFFVARYEYRNLAHKENQDESQRMLYKTQELERDFVIKSVYYVKIAQLNINKYKDRQQESSTERDEDVLRELRAKGEVQSIMYELITLYKTNDDENKNEILNKLLHQNIEQAAQDVTYTNGRLEIELLKGFNLLFNN